MSKLEELVYKRNVVERRRKLLEQEIAELNKQIETVCTHSNIAKSNKYIPGGYCYKSESLIYEHCADCGKLMKCYSELRYQGHYE
jgi:hypothetical protein